MRLSMPLLSTLLAAALLAATPAPAAPAEPGLQPAPPVPLLWKVSDADNSVYLLGSFHMLVPGDYPLSADVDAAFADAESLVFETSPAEMSSPTLALEMGQAALRTDGTRLDSELPDDLRERLRAWGEANAGALQAHGMAPAMLQAFEPWFVAITVGMVDMVDAGFSPELGLDLHFAGAAAAAGKPATGLETAQQQIAFMDRMDRAEQLQYLSESLDAVSGDHAELEQLHAAWRAGDADAVWTLAGAEMQARYPKLYQRINVQRNDAWLPLLAARLQAPGEDDTLVVVGALHLLGEDGLVAKLRARGYDVERVCGACDAAMRTAGG
jgi:uncharacterized protein YbaP (TraB family)